MKKIFLLFISAITFADFNSEKEAFIKKANYENKAEMLRLLNRVRENQEVLAKISRPAEKAKPWFEYRKIFNDEKRLQDGVNFYRQYRDVFESAEKIYGVDPFIIAAILGVETRYGTVMGNTPVLESLATLCFSYPKRAPFFCSELDYFFQLSAREGFDPLAVRGSYAGALGMAQFMPSSYFKDAINGDNNTKINLWDSPEDAIFSIANYLKKRTWIAGEKRYALQLFDISAIDNFGQSVKPYMELKNEPVGSLILQNENGDEFWLTYHNFYVITRYNTSPMYAMAVVDLAKNIETIIKREKTTNE